jgi:hypothetical protein
LCWIISTERYKEPSASYKNDVGQTNSMSAQQNGNDVAQGEQKSQQRSPMIEKIKVPIVEIIINDNCSRIRIRERE